jgi:hypothetical protein
MHFCPEGQFGDPPTPQETRTMQLFFTVPHSFEPHAALLLSATQASPESSVAGLSRVQTSSPPVSGRGPVSVATSPPGPSTPEPELIVVSVDPSRGNGIPSSMPSKLPQPPAAIAQATPSTKASAARAEAKRYPRFIS